MSLQGTAATSMALNSAWDSAVKAADEYMTDESYNEADKKFSRNHAQVDSHLSTYMSTHRLAPIRMNSDPTVERRKESTSRINSTSSLLLTTDRSPTRMNVSQASFENHSSTDAAENFLALDNFLLSSSEYLVKPNATQEINKRWMAKIQEQIPTIDFTDLMDMNSHHSRCFYRQNMPEIA